ncbi:GTP pyrophosphokinase [Plasticicumulans lactativorans]|uniref:GTP pyrophosphokinase n=1 Tax=Plasticicumulans lactativorans TaxID=1133106 RepID=A0A4R2LCV9_9GAMM|nr:GTP diphosphokinase [Plasticicumulans lactativorans]TCO82349.1 GTP pyrophosphokinase [Plasticicumulans lactativorans]
MVAPNSRTVLPLDFDAWVAGHAVRWTPEQAALVRRAHALAVPPDCTEPPAGLAVADILAELRMDHEVVAAALLEPGYVDGPHAAERLREDFGAAVAGLVSGVRRVAVIGDFHQHGKPSGPELERLRKMLLAMAQDVRVVLLALARRLQRMRTLDELPVDEQVRIARETLDLFAPLANRLGIARIKWELEDLALRHLEPQTYREIARALDEKRQERERYIGEAVDSLRADLARAGIHGEVSGRVKHIYSIWKKMTRKRVPFEEIFDVRAVRVIVDSVADCYAVLGAVHARWNHVRREFDDYIANPKPNGYRSLHTAVIGPEGRTLEVQIRTREMHQNAELGVAAHWRYKEGTAATPASAFEQQIVWLRQMLDWKDEDGDAGDFLDRFKAEALQDRVYVVTPKGQIVELPQGATPLDFAYHVHTQVGHRCRGAKVNGRIVPLNYELKNGEQIEVLTAKTGAPSRDWLSPHLGYLKSGRARDKVRAWFRQLDHEHSLASGRQTLERELTRLGVRNVNLERLAEKLGHPRPDDLFAAVGRGDVTAMHVVSVAQDMILPPPPVEPPLPIARPSRPEERGEVKISGVGNLLMQMAKCCRPVPYDPIVGFITQGRGVTIHRADCPNLLDLAAHHRERLIEVAWGEETQARYCVDVQIDAYDRTGLLRDITSVLANDKINVIAVNTLSDKQAGTARMTLTVEISDVAQLSRLLDKIVQLPNVIEARRRG